MVEVIVRNLEKIEKDETEIWKVKKLFSKYFSFGQVQTSLNSDGHLVVRLRDEKHIEKPSVEEVLIVFNILETKGIVEYVKSAIADDVFTNKRVKRA